jgi:hypothetical protein
LVVEGKLPDRNLEPKTSSELREGSMTLRSVLLSLLLASVPVAQASADEIEGRGTPGFVAQFTGSHAIANSNVFQAGSKLGVNTSSPQATLDVESPELLGILGTTSSVGLFATGVLGRTGSPTGNGVVGESAATSGTNNGVFGRAASPNGTGVSGAATSVDGGTGVYGQTAFAGSSGFGAGVSGQAVAATGTAFGVAGGTFSDEGVGVLGNRSNNSASGFGGGGVRGQTSAANFVFTYGTAGVALAPTGSSVAIFGEAWSPQGTAGLFINRPGGDILRGNVSQNPDVTVFRVNGAGKVFADGGFQASGADFAESVPVKGDNNKYAAGDLLVIDRTASGRLALSQKPYSTTVAGIFSTKPGLLGTNRRIDDSTPQNEVPLAIVGIVPCKVTDANGAIRAGDLLVSSSIPGHAMKGTDRSKMLGAVVGKALEPLQRGTGVIQVLVTLQ